MAPDWELLTAIDTHIFLYTLFKRKTQEWVSFYFKEILLMETKNEQKKQQQQNQSH